MVYFDLHRPREAPVLSQQYGGIHSGSWVDRLPASWVPYIQLARLSPPVAITLIYFPTSSTSLSLIIWTVFFSNAAHAWNDLIDYPIDLRTSRTKKRPIPRGAISARNALLFAVSQLICALLVLVVSGPATRATIYSAVPPYVLATIYYPFAKRHTHLVQVVLGLTLGWGVIIGSASMGVNPIIINGLPSASTDWRISTFDVNITTPTGYFLSITLVPSTILLFLASATWTIIYDTIYAHQDLTDDLKNNVKSLAVLFQGATKTLLWSSLCFMTSALILCGQEGNFTFWFGSLAAGGSTLALGGMISGVDLGDSGSCWWWFKYGYWLTGGSITAGLVGEYVGVLLASWGQTIW
ncbi:UbiA prenyltransferase family domain containing protein [Naviculisporaceae sp. PSN 640]